MAAASSLWNRKWEGRGKRTLHRTAFGGGNLHKLKTKGVIVVELNVLHSACNFRSVSSPPFVQTSLIVLSGCCFQDFLLLHYKFCFVCSTAYPATKRQPGWLFERRQDWLKSLWLLLFGLTIFLPCFWIKEQTLSTRKCQQMLCMQEKMGLGFWKPEWIHGANSGWGLQQTLIFLLIACRDPTGGAFWAEASDGHASSISSSSTWAISEAAGTSTPTSAHTAAHSWTNT